MYLIVIMSSVLAPHSDVCHNPAVDCRHEVCSHGYHKACVARVCTCLIGINIYIYNIYIHENVLKFDLDKFYSYKLDTNEYVCLFDGV